MILQQMIFWFIAYSILIAGTVLAATAHFRSRTFRTYTILALEISLLIMVLSASLIYYIYQLTLLDTDRNLISFMQWFFFLGITGAGFFTYHLPEAFSSKKRRTKVHLLLPSALLIGFVLYTVMAILTSFISIGELNLTILYGGSQFLIFSLFFIFSLITHIRLAEMWQNKNRVLKGIVLWGGILFLLLVFFMDILYGTYDKIQGNRELSLFFLLPVYSTFLSVLFSAYLSRTLFKSKTHTERIDRRKISSCGISARELEVIKLLIDGNSYQGIADELHISLATIQSHIRNIYRKTAVNSKIELINYCCNY